MTKKIRLLPANASALPHFARAQLQDGVNWQGLVRLPTQDRVCQDAPLLSLEDLNLTGHSLASFVGRRDRRQHPVTLELSEVRARERHESIRGDGNPRKRIGVRNLQPLPSRLWPWPRPRTRFREREVTTPRLLYRCQ